MKSTIIALSLVIFWAAGAKSQSSSAVQAASRLTQRLADSLGLTEQQKNSTYTINLALNNEKVSAKQQYQNKDLLRSHLLAIESTRASLYQPVFSPAQFQTYTARRLTLLGY